ncbi:amidohydrolase family protein [Streptomyces sp. NPDC051018]|uniref:amidohydrolase family protein n=1 Tax=Streptomyces sp. NPDC051018 TaxID=3365639 RepID=UPI00378D6486
MTVVDVNRMLGPLPYDEVPSRDCAGLLRELDRLRIDSAYVTHTHAVYGDPRDGNAALPDGGGRLRPVPVLVPGPLGTEGPAGVPPGGPVRLCPAEHRWSLTGTHSFALAARLAARRTTVLLGLDSAGGDEIRRFADAEPELRIVLTDTGYRRLRELAELMDVRHEVYLDTSTLGGHLQVEWFAERFGAHRVLFGTGAPVTDDAGPRYQLDTLELPDEDRALIAGGNALRLFGAGGSRTDGADVTEPTEGMEGAGGTEGAEGMNAGNGYGYGGGERDGRVPDGDRPPGRSPGRAHGGDPGAAR